jgi:hypothetical protein
MIGQSTGWRGFKVPHLAYLADLIITCSMLGDNRLRAKTARLTLVLLMLFIDAMVITHLIGPLRSDWALPDHNLESEATTAIFLLYGLTGMSYFFLLTASGVAFLLWLYRAYGNLYHLSPKQTRRDKSWAVGAWFEPLLNFIRSYSVMREL